MNKFIFFILFTIFVSQFVNANEKSPPKVTTQQYDNWTYQCVESGENKNCEVSQTIRIQNTNINFSVTYTKFTDDKKNKIKLITIISPLGIDLKKKLSLRFDNNEEVNLPWSSCEQIGCLVFVSKGSENSKTDDIYDKVYKNFISGNLLEIEVLGYATNQPLIIQSNLVGFKKASDKLNSDN
tara:strand:+ start:191 stop:736 length:546 start_codon:yes stop_codon:yes gene_type:complete